MITPEQQEQQRQDSLIESRCKLIEAGKLKSGGPLPGDRPLTFRLPAPDICPSCGGQMRWFPIRQAFLCVACNQPKQ